MSSGSRRTPVAVVAVVATLVVAAVVAAIVALQRPPETDAGPTPTGSSTASSSASPTTSAPSTSTTPTPTVAPPATTEPTVAPTSGPGGAPLSPVTVTVTFSGWDAANAVAVVGGYIDVLEPDGTCTLTMTLGSTVVARSAAANPDASTTSCGDASVPRSALSPGSWQAVLSYSSTTSSGAAPAVTIEVP